MRRSLPTLCLLLVTAALAACVSKRVQVPPRVDLTAWPAIGIVDFAAQGDPALAAHATARFVEMLHEAQPGARILELGPEQRLLEKVGRDQLDFESVRAIGERFGVEAVFTGALELSEVKPSVRFGEAFASLRAQANVNGRLATKLLETRSGAVVWSRSAGASENVARLGLDGDTKPSFRLGDPADAVDALLGRLVSQLTPDFHPTWRKQ